MRCNWERKPPTEGIPIGPFGDQKKKVSALGRVFAAVVTIFLVLYPISLNSIPATILYPYPEVPIEGHFI